MSTTVVTGGAGFIGSNYVRHLVENSDDQIIVLDAMTYAANEASLAGLPEDRVRLVQGDVADTNLVDSLISQAEVVVHFEA